MKHAFRDKNDGYYEIDLEEGEEFPAWTQELTSCTLQVTAPQARELTSISPRQIRQALTRVGLRASVEDAVAAGDQDTKDWWEFSTTFERNHPVVLSMVSTLGVSSEDTDNLWILGASL